MADTVELPLAASKSERELLLVDTTTNWARAFTSQATLYGAGTLHASIEDYSDGIRLTFSFTTKVSEMGVSQEPDGGGSSKPEQQQI